MKRTYSLIALWSIGYLAISTFCYPEIMKVLEGDSLFLLTPDFFWSKMAQPPGINAWLTDLLLQFFRIPFIGGLVESVSLFLISILTLAVSKSVGNRIYPEISILPALISGIVFPLFVSLQIEEITLLFGILCYLRLKTRKWRWIFCGIFSIIGFALLSFPTLFSGLLLFSLAEWKIYRSTIYKAIIPFSFIIIDVALVQISSQHIGFIPFDKRYLAIYSVSDSWKEMLFLLMNIATMVVLYALSKTKATETKSPILLVSGIVVVLASLFLFYSNKTMRHNEDCYHYVSLAETGNWQKLLEEIRQDEDIDSDLKQKYALLAEAASGTLPDHLFQYNINNPEDFLFRHQRNALGCIFNRQFYAHIGIYDEAMHNAFEYAMQQTNGNCFSSLRHMTEYAVKTGDFPVAEKYLTILGKSMTHGTFIAEQKKKIEEMKENGKTPSVPLRYDNFIGGYPFNSEMVRLLQEFPQNKKILDYLLCGLLLQKDLVKFRIILRGFPLYKEEQLPAAYAEASAMVSAEGGTIKDMFSYDNSYDQSFRDFYSMYRNNSTEAASAYPTTFWRYFFFEPLPAESSPQTAKGH